MQIDLQITKPFLLEILAGTKTVEYRECSDHNYKKFCELDSEGIATAIKPITKIRFFNGYETIRPMAIVEVTALTLDPFKGIDPDEAEKEDCYFVFELGQVLERQNI